MKTSCYHNEVSYIAFSNDFQVISTGNCKYMSGDRVTYGKQVTRFATLNKN